MEREAALSLFDTDYNCSQAVFAAFAEDHGLSKDLALKIGCSFGAGMGRMGSVCGAVTGAFLVLGLVYGKGENGSEEDKQLNYQLVRKFVQEFSEAHGSIICKEILGCDLSTDQGYQEAKEQDLFNTKCRNFVTTAVTLLNTILTDYNAQKMT